MHQDDTLIQLKSILNEPQSQLNIGQMTGLINSMRFSTSVLEFELFMRFLETIRSNPNIADAIISPKLIRAKSTVDFKLALIINSNKAIEDPWMRFYLLKSFIRKEYCNMKTKILIPLIKNLMKHKSIFFQLLLDILRTSQSCQTNTFVFCFLNLEPKYFEHLDIKSRNLLFNTFEEYITERVWTPRLFIPRFGIYVSHAAKFIKAFRDDLVISEYIKRYIDKNIVFLIDQNNDELSNLDSSQLTNVQGLMNFIRSFEKNKFQLMAASTFCKNICKWLILGLIKGIYDKAAARAFANILFEILSEIDVDFNFKQIAVASFRIIHLITSYDASSGLFEMFIDCKVPDIFYQSADAQTVDGILKYLQTSRGTQTYQAVNDYMHMLPSDLYLLHAYLTAYTKIGNKGSYTPEALNYELKEFMTTYSSYLGKVTIEDLRALTSILDVFKCLLDEGLSESIKQDLVDSFLTSSLDTLIKVPKELESLYILLITYKNKINILQPIISQPLSIVIPRGLTTNRIDVPLDISVEHEFNANILHVTIAKKTKMYDNHEFILNVNSAEDRAEKPIKEIPFKLKQDAAMTFTVSLPPELFSIEIVIYMMLPEIRVIIKRTFISL